MKPSIIYLSQTIAVRLFGEYIFRISRPEFFCKKGVLEMFAGNYLCLSLLLNKVAGLQLYYKETLVL